jgi:hypothetical protein
MYIKATTAVLAVLASQRGLDYDYARDLYALTLF